MHELAEDSRVRFGSLNRANSSPFRKILKINEKMKKKK